MTRIQSHGLTPKQYVFLVEYMECGSPSEAYRRAYGPVKSVHECSKVLLHNPKIQQALKHARDYAERQLANAAPTDGGPVSDLARRHAISREMAAQKLETLVSIDARDYFNWGPDGVVIKDSKKLTDAQAFGVIEVSQTVTKDGGTIRVKLADKQTAIMNLARMRGWLTAEEQPATPPADETKRIAARQKLIEMLTDLAKPEPLTIEGKAVRAEGGDG